jgi:polyphosphate kinase
MRRNLSHRVEVLFPLGNAKLARRVKDILDVQLADQRKSHHLQSDGHYRKSDKAAQSDAIDSQLLFLNSERAPVKTAKGMAALPRKRRGTDRRPQARAKS